jgi:hypothetical protein
VFLAVKDQQVERQQNRHDHAEDNPMDRIDREVGVTWRSRQDETIRERSIGRETREGSNEGIIDAVPRDGNRGADN